MNTSELLARECAKKNLWREAALALALRGEGGVVVASDPECGEARASLVMRQRSDQMQTTTFVVTPRPRDGAP